MGPVEVTVSVGLLMVSPWMSVRRNGGKGEVGGEHRERKGWGKEGKRLWEGLVGHVGEEVTWKCFDQLRRLCHSSLDAAVTIHYPNVVRLLSHLALPARRSSATPHRGSVRMSNLIIPYYLRPFNTRLSRPEALAAHTAVMIHPETFHTTKNLAKQQRHRPWQVRSTPTAAIYESACRPIFSYACIILCFHCSTLWTQAHLSPPAPS